MCDGVNKNKEQTDGLNFGEMLNPRERKNKLNLKEINVAPNSIENPMDLRQT